MRKRRISSPSRKARRKGTRREGQSSQVIKFLGVHLGGPKNDRTSLAILDYFPKQNKLFLSHIYEHIQGDKDHTSDLVLYNTILSHSKDVKFLCLDAPLSFPKCVSCTLRCPGAEKCKEKEIVWMWKQYKKNLKKKKRAKIFSPYMQRVVEYYLSTEIEEHLPPLEAFGANSAALTVRAHFLKRRLRNLNLLEAYPPLTVLRLGSALRISKSHLAGYKSAISGEESRQVILEGLLKQDFVFIYQQDFQRLCHNNDAFEAFICAITAFLKYKGYTEEPPKDVPLKQGWIENPTSSFDL